MGEGNWFLIVCSWEMGADDEARKRFYAAYRYLYALGPADAISEKLKKRIGVLPITGPDDLRNDIVSSSLKALNLIGRRTFVIIFQITSGHSNRVLQKLSAIISLNSSISVEIFPATYVHDLIGVLPVPPMEEPAPRSKKMREPYQKSKKMTPKAR